LYQQVDLRSDVCRALQRLVESNKDRVALTVETEVLLRVSKDEAEHNLQHLATFAGNILSILFNIYMETLPQYRGPVLQCINAYLSITAEQDLVETFGRVAATLESSLAETNGNANGKGSAPKQIMPPLTHTLMDLVITIAVYLPRSSLSQLFNIAIIVLNKDDPTLQKKAYKIIPRLAKSEVGNAALQERCEELQELLLGCADKALPPARRDRLASIGQLIPILPSSKLQFIPSVLPEVVICTKESNEKAKTNAFDLLIAMGDKMKEGGTIQNSKVPHMPPDAEDVSASLEEYLTMVLAGLAGTAPHSISASIIAITRIMYHFRESLSTATIAYLVETMDMFLKSPNREVVRSVLGFVKISIISLPVDIMQPRLVTLIPNLLNWSHEHKGRIQAKVKHIFERMMRRFGIQLVEKLTPEKDRKLITNIRKTRERRKKKKKHATDDQKTDGGEEPEASSQKKTFESGLDEAIYGSDEDSATGSDVSDDEILVGRPPRRAKKGGETYIVEDDDEPLDLLDKHALAHISTTKPLRKTEKQNKKRKATVDLDGKLILGQNPDTDMADVETGDGDLESGINAYVQAIKNIKGPRKAQRGNMKLGNSTRQHTANEDMDVDGNDGEGVKSKERNRPASRSPGRGGIKAPRGRGRGMGVEKTRGGRVTKGSSKIGRH
jgi:ribosomal RNA-processing protein 12